MGNDQPKKMAKATKGQIDIACLKAKIHLQLCRDRKNAEIIKGEKQLVAKLKSKSRNKVEEILIAERVVNGLKYAQACNLLISCAASLRGHALFLADNQDKPDKIEPWLPFIYSLIYGADHLGLSSLNQFKAVLKALNDPIAVPKYTNPEIIQLLSASPTPQELNMYMVQMSERNGIPLEQINIVGHKFSPNFVPPPSPEELQMQKKIAEQMKKQFENNSWDNHQGGNGGFNGGNGGFNGGNGGFNGGNQGFNGGNGGFNGGNQGFNGGNGGLNGGNGGFNGGNGGFNGGNGGFNGGFSGGNGGFNGAQNPYAAQNVNPYVKSQINVGPNFHMVNSEKTQPIQKPKEFSSYEDIIGIPENPSMESRYPSIDPQQFSAPKYVPITEKKSGVDNPFTRNSVVDVNGGQNNGSPTISQILRDFK